MDGVNTDKAFVGSVPKLYGSLLVPLLFQPYAEDLAGRLRNTSSRRVLEIAAGTGVVTRALVAAMPGTAIVATDLNQAMLDEAAAIGTPAGVEWRQADAVQLPFPDESFDAVVCQFGVMFFPDKPKAFAEARRVLRPGGTFLFNVWDRIEDNELADVITEAVSALTPADPPLFLRRTPHGYHDISAVTTALRNGGFSKPPRVETKAARGRTGSARTAAIAYCQGTPLRSDLEARGLSPEAATEAAAAALAARFGHGSIDSKIQAHVFTIER